MTYMFPQAQSHELSMWETEILAGLQTDIVSSIGYAEKTKRVGLCGYICACMIIVSVGVRELQGSL